MKCTMKYTIASSLLYHAFPHFLLLLFLCFVTICATERILSLSTKYLISSFPILQRSKTIPKRKPKSHSLNAFLRHSWIIESPMRKKHETLRNMSNSEIFQHIRPIPQINTKTNHDSFPLDCFFLLHPVKTPPLRTFSSSNKIPFPSLWANSPIREFNGCGKILRFNATMDASLSINFLDGWEPPRPPVFLAHVIGCRTRIKVRKQGWLATEMELQRRQFVLIPSGTRFAAAAAALVCDTIGWFRWLLKVLTEDNTNAINQISETHKRKQEHCK